MVYFEDFALMLAFTTAVIGVLLGFFGQRSRMCFIGGWRDFFLIRDTYLLKGFFTFLLTAIVLFYFFDTQNYYLKGYPFFKAFTPEQMSTIGYLGESLNVCELIPYVFIADEVHGITIGSFTISYAVLVQTAAAFGLGLLSALANGCPMRQHVLAGSGDLSAWLYLCGFYLMAAVYPLIDIHI